MWDAARKLEMGTSQGLKKKNPSGRPSNSLFLRSAMNLRKHCWFHLPGTKVGDWEVVVWLVLCPCSPAGYTSNQPSWWKDTNFSIQHETPYLENETALTYLRICLIAFGWSMAPECEHLLEICLPKLPKEQRYSFWECSPPAQGSLQQRGCTCITFLMVSVALAHLESFPVLWAFLLGGKDGKGLEGVTCRWVYPATSACSSGQESLHHAGIN